MIALCLYERFTQRPNSFGIRVVYHHDKYGTFRFFPFVFSSSNISLLGKFLDKDLAAPHVAEVKSEAA